MIIFKLDIEGLVEFPSPMIVIKDLSVSLKTFDLKEVIIEDITRKERKILVLEGVLPKKPRTEKVRVRFQIHTDLTALKKKFPDGKLLGQVALVSGIPLYVYREQK